MSICVAFDEENWGESMEEIPPLFLCGYESEILDSNFIFDLTAPCDVKPPVVAGGDSDVVKSTESNCEYAFGKYRRGRARVLIGKLAWARASINSALLELEKACDELCADSSTPFIMSPQGKLEDPCLVSLEKIFSLEKNRPPPAAVVGAKVAPLLVAAAMHQILNRFMLKLDVLIRIHYRRSRDRRKIKLICDRYGSFCALMGRMLRERYQFIDDFRSSHLTRIHGPVELGDNRDIFLAKYKARNQNDSSSLNWHNILLVAKRLPLCEEHDDDCVGLYEALEANSQLVSKVVLFHDGPEDFPVIADMIDDNCEDEDGITYTIPYESQFIEWGGSMRPLQYNCTVRDQVEVMRGTLIAGSGNGNVAKRKRVRKRATQPQVRAVRPRPSANAPAVVAVEREREPSLPTSMGGRLGSYVGHGIQKVVETVLGLGDYKVKQNSLVYGMSPAEIQNYVLMGMTIYTHREFLGEVLSTVDFVNTVYPLQPALLASFPWLSTSAACFEQWKPLGIIYELKSTSSDAVLSSATSSALGMWGIAADYNALAPPYATLTEFLNSEFAESSKPSCDVYHLVECKPSRTTLTEMYTRTGVLSTGDIRFNDLCNIQVATQGQQANGGSLGQLWVTYQIGFLKPQIPNFADFSVLTDHFQLGTVTNAAPLGTTSLLVEGSSLSSTISDDGTTLLFPPLLPSGTFLVVYDVLGTDAVALSFAEPAFTNCDFDAFWLGDGAANVGNTGTTSNLALQCFIVTLSAFNASFSMAVTTLPAIPLEGDLWICQINTGILTTFKRRNKTRKVVRSKSLADIVQSSGLSEHDARKLYVLLGKLRVNTNKT